MFSVRKSKVVPMLIGFGGMMLAGAWPCGADDQPDQAKPLALSTRLESLECALSGLCFTGQMTGIYQASSLKLRRDDLPNANADTTGIDPFRLKALDHKSRAATLSADLSVQKNFQAGCFMLFDIEYANGFGVDGPFPGGAQVNNDVMEAPNHHSDPYIARVFYEHNLPLTDGYSLTFDLGKFSVVDFFDKGNEVADQTTQFLNQAICNNGAFDYAQDIDGHGYTYGVRAAADSPWLTLSGGTFSVDSVLDNIADKYSAIGELDIKANYTDTIRGVYRVYAWKNWGEYAGFDRHGNLISKDPTKINTRNNKDNKNKAGYGISLDQSLPMGINIFGRYGRQQDDRDVRLYQDQDQNIMFGFDVSGANWKRDNDIIGVAYEIGKLTGNHRKAQENGYTADFFTHSGIGKHYSDERVLETYYRYAITKQVAVSVDYQHFSNFDYSHKIGDVNFWGGRFHVSF